MSGFPDKSDQPLPRVRPGTGRSWNGAAVAGGVFLSPVPPPELGQVVPYKGDGQATKNPRKHGTSPRKYRIGLPPALAEPLSGKHLSHYEEVEDSQQYNEYQKLRANVTSIQDSIDAALQQISADTTHDPADPEAFSHRMDANGHSKITKLQTLVNETLAELRVQKRRTIDLEEEVDDLRFQLHEKEAIVHGMQNELATLRSKRDNFEVDLETFRKEHSIAVFDKSQLAEEVARLRKQSVADKKMFEAERLHLQRASQGKPKIDSKLKNLPTKPQPSSSVLTLSSGLKRFSENERGPEGRLTLVFTDIQGSTSLWEALGEKMHGELEKHNTVIRQEISQWKGYEVKTQGDSFMVAFADVTKAACFCLSVQLKLMTVKWEPALDSIPDSVPRNIELGNGIQTKVWNGLRVRMGMHVGEPICQIDITSGRMDYFGPMVNQSARVQGVALGGMISLTPEIRKEIVLSKIPGHLQPHFEDIGIFTLKGISEPVMLQQVLPVSLKPRLDDFVPLKTRDKTEDTSGAPTGTVCLVFLRIVSAINIEQTSAELWANVLKVFQNEVRVTAEVAGGYISLIDADRVTLAFQYPKVGFKWAMDLQSDLMNLLWDSELCAVPGFEDVQHQGRSVLTGPRVQIGMHVDECDTSYNPVTKTVTYVGSGVPVAGAMSLEAKGGETLISEEVYMHVHGLKDIFVQGAKGVCVEGCEGTYNSYYAFPKNLPERANHLMESDIVEITQKKKIDAKLTTAPFGKLALVFTDVQNSTVLWEADELAMSQSVRLHHEWMRTGLAKFNGYEVKTEGDAFMVAFHGSPDAMRWCLYMQEMLLNLDYPKSLLKNPDARPETKRNTLIWRGLRVRMGIHVGTPRCETDPTTGRMDYYGQMVNKAARVSGLAQGGQIIMSEEAYLEIQPKLLELGAPVITDGGEVSLKGIKKKAKVFTAVSKSLKARTFFKSKLVADEDTAITKLLEEHEKAKMVKTPSAPIGRVAIAFTDIQNSTVLWEKCSKMAQVVQIHHKMMREGIRKFNGYEVKTEGDAFMVAFGSSKDGVGWCLHMQQQLMDGDWFSELLQMSDACKEESKGKLIWRGPRVRMGLHVGQEPELGWEKDECTQRMDYYGKMVNKAARVSGLGKGGEIVISSDCHEDISHEKGITPYQSVSLGSKTLKGIDKPVQVYSLVPKGFEDRRKTWAARAQRKAPQTDVQNAQIWYEKYQAELARKEEERKMAPSGNVTLVFTDVQGSTKLWDTDDKVMAEAVQIHHEIMRSVIAKLGGYEVKTEGDAFMVAFHNPTVAAKWCITVQRELLTCEWPENLLHMDLCKPIYDEEENLIWRGLRVRMGFHTGEVETVVDPTTERIDYYGPMVNASARIGGLGVGGEIVTSFESADSIELPDAGNPIIMFLEQRTLKGISQEFEIYRIIPTDLASRELPKPETRDDIKRKFSDRQSIISEYSVPEEEDGEPTPGKPVKSARTRSFKEEITAVKKDNNNLRDDLTGYKAKLKAAEKAEQERAFEVYRIHRHLRIFMNLIRKYGDCAVDRTKGVFSQTDMVHEWIRQHRLIMSAESPGEHGVVRRRDDKKQPKPNVEMKTQKELAIESQKDEETHITFLNGTWQVATSKLSRSIVGHLSKHFFYFHTNMVQPLLKARSQKEKTEEANFPSRFQRSSLRYSTGQHRGSKTDQPYDSGEQQPQQQQPPQQPAAQNSPFNSRRRRTRRSKSIASAISDKEPDKDDA
eukprot:TRINITY_DN3848_c0_g1_i2.p1 TRINITY_DN3848_c0_g1~~TRINITY_DN3848_c0_g1_i2.p1  ORF type:complete len:1731 (+),score=385.11 TRINITY_DN3848_c0_g1_i2:32-5194(+)